MGDFSVLISDTVGFIKNIPTTLIESFKSTLETAVYADLILIVCDALTDWSAQLDTTEAMLDELKATGKRLIVFNKCENLSDFSPYPSDAIFISAKEKRGLDGLILKIKSFFEENYIKLTLKIPYSEMSKFHALQKYIENSTLEYTDEYLFAEILINKVNLSKFNAFIK